MKTEQKNTTCIIRDTFIDMALCMEFLFVIHGANRLLEEDIVRCMEEKYEKAITNLKKSELRNTKVKWETPVDNRSWPCHGPMEKYQSAVLLNEPEALGSLDVAI